MKTNFLKIDFFKMMLLSCLLVACTSDDDPISNTIQNDLSALQGEWFRIGGNNPSNDGMKVKVNDDAGKVEDPQSSGYLIGDIKWKDILIQNNGIYSYLELGSDNNYYSAEMTLKVDDTLRISVASSGAGNIQKWVRQYTATPELHECTPRGPGASNGSFQDNWSEINEVDAFSIMSVPSDESAGAIVNVTLQTEAPVIPCFNLFAGSDLATGLQTGNNDTTTRTYRFVGQPGTLFSGETTDCENALSDQYPWDYTVSWAYMGITDCYEPNDTFIDAKAVPKNQEITAMGVAGYTDGGLGIYDPSTYDWYKVTINEPSKIRMTLNQCPSDIHMHFRIFENNNGKLSNISVTTEEISGGAHDPGSSYYIQTNGVLEAGTYLIEAHRLRGPGTSDIVEDDDPNPVHWSTPYSFIVTTEN